MRKTIDKILMWGEGKIFILRDWLWPETWPTVLRNTLTGIALMGIYNVIWMAVFFLLLR